MTASIAAIAEHFAGRTWSCTTNACKWTGRSIASSRAASIDSRQLRVLQGSICLSGPLQVICCWHWFLAFWHVRYRVRSPPSQPWLHSPQSLHSDQVGLTSIAKESSSRAFVRCIITNLMGSIEDCSRVSDGAHRDSSVVRRDSVANEAGHRDCMISSIDSIWTKARVDTHRSTVLFGRIDTLAVVRKYVNRSGYSKVIVDEIAHLYDVYHHRDLDMHSTGTMVGRRIFLKANRSVFYAHKQHGYVDSSSNAAYPSQRLNRWIENSCTCKRSFPYREHRRYALGLCHLSGSRQHLKHRHNMYSNHFSIADRSAYYRRAPIDQ